MSARALLPRFGAALLIAVAVVLGAAPASAPPASATPRDVDDFSFESMEVDFTLTRDADGTSRLRVVETIVALFPEYDQNRGIVRDIPSTEFVPGLGRVEHDVRIVGVTDERGDPVPFETASWTDDDGTVFAQVATGTDEYVRGRTTYVLEWTADDVVLPFADTRADEFYWDVNGVGSSQSFGSVTAELLLPDELAAVLTGSTACYAGSYGSTTPCDIARTADGFRVDAGALEAGETATLAIGFDPGTFRAPVPFERTWPFTVLPWVLLGVLAAATVLIVVFRRVLWRHHPGRGIVIPEYEGPDELGIMPAATLLSRRGAALPAQIVRLATTGAAQLVEDPDEPEDRRFRLVVTDLAAATGWDGTALRKLFPKKAKTGTQLVLDRKDRELGDRVATLASDAVDRTKGYLSTGRRSPLRRLIFWPGLAVLLAAIGLVVTCAVTEVASYLLTLQNTVAIVGAILVMGFSGKPFRRTAKGAAAYEQLLGLREYLRLAEADRMRVLQSPEGAVRERIDPDDPAAVVRLYERLLPWAVLWGVEKQWSEVLASRYDGTVEPTPTLGLAAGLSGISTLGRSFASSSFATTPTTSSSSSGSGGGSFSGGSFGGGFSGGGGGGGGIGGR